MSTKRINFLDRKKILQQHLRLTLQVNGRVKRFTPELELSSYGFPPEAIVVVEARNLFESLHFGLGAIGSGLSKAPQDISKLETERVTFNVYVLDPETARKYGYAETVRPISVEGTALGTESLLPVDLAEDLGGVLWAVRYVDRDDEGHSDAPVLVFDKQAAQNSAADFVKDVRVRAMVLPAAFREILFRVLVADEHLYAAESDAWKDAWLRFGSNLVGEDPPSSEAGATADELIEWSERAVQRLAVRGELLRNFVRGLSA